MSNQVIKVTDISGSEATLDFLENNVKLFSTKAFIGKNGITNDKREGDGKTPIGKYNLGVAFGMHDEIEFSNYIKITKNLHWVDDINSKFYNQLVDITKVRKDWNSSEHLIEHPKQYEYAMEIKTNPKNIPNKGSAIFLHCSAGKPTAGCVAIDSQYMKLLLEKLQNNAVICIEI